MLNQSYYNSLEKNVKKALETYDFYSQIQQIVGDTLIANLPPPPPFSYKLLDLGCGNGVVTEKVTAHLKPNHLDLLDLSSEALEIAQKRTFDAKTRLLCQNFDRSFKKSNYWDFIFSNMSVQWSRNLPELFQKIYHTLKPKGVFAFSLPLKTTFHELQKKKITTENFFTFKEVKHLLVKSNFTVIQSFYDTHIQQFSSLYHGLKSLKFCGVSSPKRTGKVLSKKELFTPTTLTYVVGYYIARKS